VKQEEESFQISKELSAEPEDYALGGGFSDPTRFPSASVLHVKAGESKGGGTGLGGKKGSTKSRLRKMKQRMGVEQNDRSALIVFAEWEYEMEFEDLEHFWGVNGNYCYHCYRCPGQAICLGAFVATYHESKHDIDVLENFVALSLFDAQRVLCMAEACWGICESRNAIARAIIDAGIVKCAALNAKVDDIVSDLTSLSSTEETGTVCKRIRIKTRLFVQSLLANFPDILEEVPLFKQAMTEPLSKRPPYPGTKEWYDRELDRASGRKWLNGKNERALDQALPTINIY